MSINVLPIKEAMKTRQTKIINFQKGKEKMKKTFKKFFAALLAILMIFSTMPIYSFAAPASDIPAEMLDNDYLDALAYTGYKVQAQKNDGSIFIKYAYNANSYLSGIGYDSSFVVEGTETVSDSGTKTGRAPNIARFKQNGLCCAAYVSYVLFNYMPNIKGYDVSNVPRPSNLKAAASYHDAAEKWVDAGLSKRISFTQSSNGKSFKPSEEIPIGSLIVFRNSGEYSHVALYAGKYNGKHFVTHTGNSRGPEIHTIEEMEKGGGIELVSNIYTPPVTETDGIIEIYKKDPNGKNLSGAYFVATNESDSSKQYLIGPTNSDGYVNLDGIPYGNYTVKETVFPTNYTSNGQTEWKVTVDSNNNGVATINAVNAPKTGSLTITKTAEDGIKKGHKFHLFGTSNIGTKVDEYATTNDQGKATFENIQIGSNYTVEEVDTAIRYVVPDNQTASIEWEKVTNKNFENILKKFRVTVTKRDAEKGDPQGDASLAGAVYGIYKGSELVDTYTTDASGQFTTKYYVCGDDWTIKEITASEGYLVDNTVHKVGADPKLYTVEHNNKNLDVVEQVKKGKISIIKHTDNGDTQIETPENGAEFQIYLKSAGSYSNADKDERDTIVCDADGFTSSKLLPYGVYTVHQTKGWDGREKIADFDVYIQTDNQTYKFLINNRNFESYLKVVKADAETGKQIAYEGAGFEIFDSEGHRVTMQYTYPEVTSIHTFYTNSEGYLITPEKLPYGDYTLVEVQAPYGYVLDSTPIPFSIAQENSSTDTGVTVVMVKAKDLAQKGVIEITKTGEIFSSVTNSSDIYTPLFENKGLENATFEIYAYEDITTLDGTVRANAGQLVDTITTNTEGIAQSQQLYLGKYLVKEITAPDTFVLNSKEYIVELTYAGQEVSVTSTTLSVYNDRQKVEISLLKVLEQDNLYKIGINGEISSVQFGIFANEDIAAADGSIIPKDGLITYANCDKNGNITFDCDLPIGFSWYAKEIAVDNHYLISNDKYEFSTEYQGQDIAVINIKINDGNTIENVLKRGSVQGIKVDEYDKPLAGAIIGIFAPGTTKFTEENAIAVAVSAKDGSFAFENVPYGEWIVKELKAPQDYLLDDNSYTVKLSDNENTVTLKIINMLKRGDIQGIKVDNRGNVLEGALIGLFSADTTEFTEKTAIMTTVSTEDGKFSFSDIPVGNYIVKELKAPKGYILSDKNYEVSLTENQQIIEIRIVNTIKLGELKLNYNSTSPKTGADYVSTIVIVSLIAGAVVLFAVRAAKGKKVQK